MEKEPADALGAAHPRHGGRYCDHRAGHCTVQAVSPWQRLHQRTEYASGRDAGHLAGRAEPVHEHPVLCTAVLVRAQVHRPGHLCQRHWRRVHCHGLLRPHCSPLGPAEALGLPVQLLWVALAVPVTALGACCTRRQIWASPRTITSRWPAGLHPGAVLRPPRVHRCTVCAAVLAAGRPCGHRYADLCLRLGPFIQFFNGLVSERVLHLLPGGQ